MALTDLVNGWIVEIGIEPFDRPFCRVALKDSNYFMWDSSSVIGIDYDLVEGWTKELREVIMEYVKTDVKDRGNSNISIDFEW